MRVDPLHPGATTPTAEKLPRAARHLDGAFASLHAAALAQGSGRASTGTATRTLSSAQLFPEPTRVAQAAATRTTGSEAADRTTAPKNEKTRPVEGHKYSEIMSGPRNGMYLNQSGNERDGMAFVLVKRNGREFHVYGSGKDRLICEVRHKPKPTTPATTTTPAPATTTSPTTTTSGGSAAAPQANPTPSAT